MSSGGSTPQFGERAEYGAEDVCYRHPGVQSFTLCQRCGRTICSDCQTASAVGVLCPECVRATRPGAAQRVGRSARVMSRRASNTDTPIVTYGIMILCALVFVGQLFSDSVTQTLWYAPFYSLPSDLAGAGSTSFEPWRMLTVMFTHSPSFFFHILFNMIALWLFGRNLEHMIGRLQFAVLYVFAGVGGALGVMFWAYVDPASLMTPTVGASGAIFGVLAATLVAFRAANVNITSLAVLITINFVIGLIPGSSISWQAHLGGLIVGALTMQLMVVLRGPRKRGMRIAATVGLGVVLVALSCAYFVALPLPSA
ncbi:rhomboid family intramembrane serine protease [Leucobacter tardus]|uniref:Rhomboid family intramembrane serine protease n=1 Tax=Leucobacter tardus TaxID=501483 RepID=A0A939TIZ7_9MICO|nr:rhomboid family intramembrane serine protease [Leucobacter tardus]MBO2988691.1 rhomboid family intramembrane serine protease [Leucobacter tardus]